MRLAIVTRSINETLYKRMISTINIDKCGLELGSIDLIRRTEFSGVRGSLKYLLFCCSLFNDYDYVINIDDDCLIIDNEGLVSLIYYMKDLSYDFCGMPDGGVCSHRSHNPLVTNPFFNILSKRFCKFAHYSIDDVRSTRMSGDLKEIAVGPQFINNTKFEYDDFEPYYCIFLWAHKHLMNPLYLNARGHTDRVSTILKNQYGVDFLVHTWYAREYKKDNEALHTKRIDSCFKYFIV